MAIGLLVGGALAFMGLTFYGFPTTGFVIGGALFVAGVVQTISATRGLIEVNQVREHEVCVSKIRQCSRFAWSFERRC